MLTKLPRLLRLALVAAPLVFRTTEKTVRGDPGKMWKLLYSSVCDDNSPVYQHTSDGDLHLYK